MFSGLFQLPEAPTLPGLWPLPLSSKPATAGAVFLTSHHSDYLSCLSFPFEEPLGWYLRLAGSPEHCNLMQVRLPAALKAKTPEAGPNVKTVVFYRCRPPGRGGAYVSKPISSFSVEAEIFIRRERGTEQRDQRVGKFPICRRAQSIPIKTAMVWCASSWLYITLASRHPASTVEGQQISWSRDAWRSVCIFWS